MPKKEAKKRRKIIILSLVFLFVLLSPYFILAQERKLEIEYPEFFGLQLKTIDTSLLEYVKYVFNFSVAIIGLVLLASLIKGGILYLTSSGNVAKLSDARNQISSAFLGTILLLAGYLILTTINPNLAALHFPPLTEKPLCQENKDCPRGFECKETKCVMRTSCGTSEDCPYTYECKEGKCVKTKEVTTQIFWEIPIGQMLEDGLWEKKRTTDLDESLKNFKEFLTTSEYESSFTYLPKKLISSIKNTGVFSKLTRDLMNLTNECHCEELTAICQKPKNFAAPVGCFGDPCVRKREEINDVLKKLRKKSIELSNYRDLFSKITKGFEEEGRKFRNLKENILESCKARGLLTRAEFYDSLAFLEEQGGKTELKRLYAPAQNDDPLVFYCEVGGTVFDYPYAPEKIPLPEKTELPEELITVPTEGEPLSCPIEISIDFIMDEISAISYETNANLEELLYYMDKISAELTKMAGFVSQCNESRCDVSCSCIYNPCYQNYSLCNFPIFICCPFLKSPCLQSVGGCHGDPCPRQKIKETVELIKIYENEILGIGGKIGLLEKIGNGIKAAENTLRGEKADKPSLDQVRKDLQSCIKLGTRTWNKPERESFWVLLPCEMAIGNKWINGDIITNCHPQSFFCCSNKSLDNDVIYFETESFFSQIAKEGPPVSTPLPEGPYFPTTLPPVCDSNSTNCVVNNVPYFSQHDDRWRNQLYGCGTTIGNAGSGPTSLAMALNFFDVKVDPLTIADWAFKNGYLVCASGTIDAFCCRAVEKFGKEKGVKCEEHHRDVKAVLQALGKGKVAVVNERAVPPYSQGGHFIVLTGTKEEWSQKFVYYNDPNYDFLLPKTRPAQTRKPIDWFEKQGIGAGCVIYK